MIAEILIVSVFGMFFIKIAVSVIYECRRNKDSYENYNA